MRRRLDGAAICASMARPRKAWLIAGLCLRLLAAARRIDSGRGVVEPVTAPRGLEPRDWPSGQRPGSLAELRRPTAVTRQLLPFAEVSDITDSAERSEGVGTDYFGAPVHKGRPLLDPRRKRRLNASSYRQPRRAEGRPVAAAEPSSSKNEAAATSFEVSFEEAYRFVSVVGGLHRLHELLSAGSVDPPEERQPSETTTTQKDTDAELFRRWSEEFLRSNMIASEGALDMQALEAWGRRVLKSRTSRAELTRWMQLPETAQFFMDVFDVEPWELALLQDIMVPPRNDDDDTASRRDEGVKFRFYRAGGIAPIADFVSLLKPLGDLPNFGFVHTLGGRLHVRAQVIAEVLARQRKFVASCPSHDPRYREMRFRATTIDGKLQLEARFLGSVEKYPVLQPWVTHEHPDIIMFFGRQSRGVFDPRKDLVDPVNALKDPTDELPDTRVFYVSLFKRNPIIWIFSVHAGFVLSEKCIGGIADDKLQDYFKFADQMERRKKESNSKISAS